MNVAVIGFRNTPNYCQRQMDNRLRDMPWAKAYVDDVVNASSSFEEHLLHLRKLFTFFRKLGLSAKPSKVFLGYPSTVVLG